MKLSALLIWILSALMLSLAGTGCSWINWQKMPEKETDRDRIYCNYAPATFDTIMAAAFVGGAGGSFAAASSADKDCEHAGDTFCGGLGYEVLGGILIGVAAIWAAASFSGWANYSNCLEYNKRLEANEKLGTTEKLFHPEATEKPVDSSASYSKTKPIPETPSADTPSF